MFRWSVLLAALTSMALPSQAAAAHLFFSESSTPGIQRAEADGTGASVVAPVAAGGPAADATHLYWPMTSSGQLTIARADLDGQNANTNWLTGLGLANNPQLAVGGGNLCWSRNYVQGGARYGVICLKLAEDGTPGAPKVVYDTDVYSVGGPIAVDQDYVYFAHGPLINGPLGSIARVGVDGSNPQTEFVPGIEYVRGLAVNDNKIFYSEWNKQSLHPPVPAVYSVNKSDGSGKQVITVLDQAANVSAVAANNTYVYWTQSATGDPSLSRVGRASASGGDVNSNLMSKPGYQFYGLATEAGGGCKDTLDFHTSMVATGCFEDQGGGKWKAKGAFRVNGIDGKSTDDDAYPVIFDTDKKRIDGDQVMLSVSASGWGPGWLATKVPDGVHIAFPGPVTSWTMPLVLNTIPSGAGVPFAFNALGFLQLGGLVSPTLFGYPAHAPYADLTMTSGTTQVTLQLSWPTRADAFLDPINGLWKVPNGRGGSRVNYPTALKVVGHASNDSGVDRVEGTFSPANVYGIDPSKGRDGIIWGSAGAPAEGVIELAKTTLGWQLAKGVVDLGAVLVFHRAPWDGAAKALPKSFFLGRPVGNVSAALTWWKFPTAAIPNAAAPLPTEIKFGLNSLNEPIGKSGLYWQRIGFTGGYDLNKGDRPLHLGGSLGFSFLPRFKHDFLWFQEAAALDVNGDIAFNPTQLAGTGDLSLAGVKLAHGGFTWGPEGFLLEGSLTMKLNALFKYGVPLESTGTATFLWPDDSDWQVQGELRTKVLSFPAIKSTMVWNEDGIGFCFTAGAFRGKAYVFDGSWRWAGCDLGPFLRAASARVNLRSPNLGGGFTNGGKEAAAARPVRFTVRPGSKLQAVAIRGRSGSPRVTVTGPGGLRLTVGKGTPAAMSGNTALVMNDVRRGDKTTTLMFGSSARPGNYTVLPNGPTITGIGFAQPLPAPKVRGTVRTTSGCQRQLSWNARAISGQKLKFLEHTGVGPDRALLTTAKNRGRRAFTPADSSAAKRTILAQVIQRGAVRRTITVARFRTGGATPGRVGGVSVRLHAKKNVVRWRGVCGATGYQVTNGATVTGSAKPTATITATKGSAITVRAVGPTGKAGAASKPIKAR